MQKLKILLISFILLGSTTAQAQVDDRQLGAWYMYIYSLDLDDSPWGVQGDFQYRNWDLGGDMEQLMLRSGLTYRVEKTKYTLGYAHIISSAFDLDSVTTREHRIYQEALIWQGISPRLSFTHRLRLEERFWKDSDPRGRFRYGLFANVHLGPYTSDARWYLSFYNEVFVNARLGNSASPKYFDRNRLYGAVGFKLSSQLKLQVGVMNQTTQNWSKNQLQFNLIQKF
jgi:hypothetical protein